MTTKRWTAISIAIGLFILSIIISDLTLKANPTGESDNAMMETANLFLGQQALSETIVSKGNQKERIVLLEVNGAIVANQTASLLDTSGYNHTFFIEQLEAIKVDDSIKGILLSINSPGGGTYESAQIKDKIDEIQKTTKIPLYVSMGNVAASGGYYIAASADKIFASNETLTGSIGVIMSNLNVSELYKKIGIEDTTIKSGPFKDIGSTSKQMSKEEEQILQSLVDDSYNRFVTVVAEGRNKKTDEVKSLADGRIYDGAQAKGIGLVDQIGYQENALEALKKENKIEDAEVFQYSSDSLSFKSLLTSKVSELTTQKSMSEEMITELTKQLNDIQTPRMMYLYGGK
ncbi:signal peptide peptidase A. Serine peptidase. MEROPS family S49 [Carnobacterium iners]|uniref:Signal peptide peptidase A. Serine peptidase. MEROPS family S49 n=1 Tax=Carnobacterium iners TaxID=1073423 RepID=A0A1X7NG59_9LACT|nr:signal peptide peptidase SppA [Carnobacterium iners]SEK40542.1 signal peptide peptidase A. Serine peptidase. MEROPS family S49 [Carnobacterium iners]SMH36698.1 signal peptide peptidase A. Serine peptidase. MEROPS family S49 [Carnobacterium iners]